MDDWRRFSLVIEVERETRECLDTRFEIEPERGNLRKRYGDRLAKVTYDFIPPRIGTRALLAKIGELGHGIPSVSGRFLDSVQTIVLIQLRQNHTEKRFLSLFPKIDKSSLASVREAAGLLDLLYLQ